MDLGLQDTVAVVTGAGRGIGLASVRALVSEGALVVAGSLTVTPELAQLAQEGRVRPVEVDLASAEGPGRLIAEAGPELEVLVNNVGFVHPRPEGFGSVDDGMWEMTIQLDLMAHVRAVRAALPLMLARGRGRIVNIGSANARLADPLVVDYSAAKAALVNLGKSLAKEFAPRGIRVNTVDPGPVATDLWLGAGGVADVVGAASGQAPDAVRAGAAASMPTGRFTLPQEVGDLVAVLASDRWPNLTAADLAIDGGLVAMV